MSSVKIHAKPTGIPRARVSAGAGTTDAGAAQVTMFISALSAFDLSEVVCSLRLSPSEARDVAALLITNASKADGLVGS